MAAAKKKKSSGAKKAARKTSKKSASARKKAKKSSARSSKKKSSRKKKAASASSKSKSKSKKKSTGKTGRKKTAAKKTAKKKAAKKSTSKKKSAKKTAATGTKKTPKPSKSPAKASGKTSEGTKTAAKKTSRKVAARAGSKPIKRLNRTSAMDPDQGADLEEAAERLPPLEKRISRKDLRTIREKLLERRAQLVGSLQYLEAEHLGTKEHSTNSGGDEADKATTGVTSDISLRLAESESRELRDINDALRKLTDGTYGICEMTGKPIGTQRLLFLPSARLSIEAQKQLEAQSGPYGYSRF